MPFSFHADRPRYFEIQRITAQQSVIPFIERTRPVRPEDRVLEIGSAEGGVLAAFLERGCRGTGIELSRSRAALAEQFLAEPIEQGRASILGTDVYDMVDDPAYDEAFDVVVLKDVIEHIHDQARLLRALRRFVKPHGIVFLGFPPWQMPFGGHQQMFDNRLLAVAPYTHLLPLRAYAGLMRLAGESDRKIDAMLEIRQTGLSLERFESIVRETGWVVQDHRLFAIAPIYRYKFGLPTIAQSRVVSRLPGVRNFVTSAAYYVLRAAAAPG